MNSQVDQYISQAGGLQDSLNLLRRILGEFPLQEDFKWRTPCYRFNNANLVLLGYSANGCSLGFLKGALLQDPKQLLQAPGQNTRAARMLAFADVQAVQQMEPQLRAFIEQAIELEKSGAKIDFEKDRALPYPDELTRHMDEDPAFAKAFRALTPGRQRGYILHFSQAKQSATRTARIQKYHRRICQGKGILDCVCGLSKRMPNCDGSHKQLDSQN